jgi:hypothetical protein
MIPRCKQCGGGVDPGQVAPGQLQHFICASCRVVYAWDSPCLTPCSDPFSHLLAWPEWAVGGSADLKAIEAGPMGRGLL